MQKNYKKHFCNVCLKSKNILLFKKVFKIDDKLEWFEKSIISILGNKNINYNIFLCYSCFHIFVSSNINSNLLYTSQSPKIRKELFQKQYPNKIYGYNLKDRFHHKLENKRINRITKDIVTQSKLINKKDIHVLDYGGDDGYLINQIKKKINVKDKKNYFFELFDPQIHNNLIQTKFDVILISHVLEHITNLDEFFHQFKKYIHKNSLIIIEVPDERSIFFKILLKKRIYLDYHLNYFTICSLKTLLFRYKLNFDTKYIYSSYRGNKIMSIYGLAYFSNKSIYLLKFKEILNLILFLPKKIFFSFFT